MINNTTMIHKNGTYAALYLSAISQQNIHSIINEKGIYRKDELEELHCTVIYSKTPFPEAIFATIDVAKLLATPIEYKVWTGEDDKTYLVLIIESSDITKLHKSFVDFGASHGFDKYEPHVTITDEWDYSIDVNEIPLPDTITFNKFLVMPLKA